MLSYDHLCILFRAVARDNTTPSLLKSGGGGVGGGASVAPRKGSIPTPVDLTATVLSSSYVSLAWKPPQSLKDSLEILGYLITWKEEGSMRFEIFLFYSAKTIINWSDITRVCTSVIELVGK